MDFKQIEAVVGQSIIKNPGLAAVLVLFVLILLASAPALGCVPLIVKIVNPEKSAALLV